MSEAQKDRLVHILVVHFDMPRDKAVEAANLSLTEQATAPFTEWELKQIGKLEIPLSDLGDPETDSKWNTLIGKIRTMKEAYKVAVPKLFPPAMAEQRTCKVCGGTGDRLGGRCPECLGTGLVRV